MSIISNNFKSEPTIIKGIGIAMPGPFDYQNGISLMCNLNKFDSLFGVNIRQYLCKSFDLNPNQITFLNDAACFALGEYKYGSLRESPSQKCICITVGTGFGSTFLDYGGRILTEVTESVPENGWLYNQAFKDGIAEDYFSDKWILKQYEKLTGQKLSKVDLIKDDRLDEIYNELAYNLANFLEKWINLFQPTSLIIGGNIIKYKNYFLINKLKQNLKVAIYKSELLENAALLGAISSQSDLISNDLNNDLRRLTKQHLLPIYKESIQQTNSYSSYPHFNIGKNKISIGFDSIVDYLLTQNKVWALDGYIGIDFDNLRSEVDSKLKNLDINVIWKEVSSCKKSQNEIDSFIECFKGGDDPLFGKRCNLSLKYFYDDVKLSIINKQKEDYLIIIIGIGSALIDPNIPVIYFDLPKNEIQYQSRAKIIKNFCTNKLLSDKETYKLFYFIDWPVLNEHKRYCLNNNLKAYVDMQHYDEPVLISGDDLKLSIENLSSSLIRVRPWFESGVWGGDWIKTNIKDSFKDVINYAWSFELISQENGVILTDDTYLIEISFDLLMFHNNESILGKKIAQIFKYEFPIRVDFLDTWNGANLSIQCHAGSDYMQTEFGETMAQDETYYILDADKDSKVYLGFQDSIDPDTFRLEIENSFEESTPIQIEQFVQCHESRKHDFFSIPNGTIHGSGAGNLVLEISSAPYIFTFKIYDWVRLDLNGTPRTLNIERAFKNLDFTRKGHIIKKENINNIKTIMNESDCKIFHLATNNKQFYDVHRIEFTTGLVKLNTDDCFSVLTLVEGDCIQVETKNGYKMKYYFAETFIVPAGAISYEIKSLNNKLCKVLKAFIKNDFII